MLLFIALSCLATAAVGSVVVYQRGAARRLAGGIDPARLPAPAGDGGRDGSERPEPTLESLQHGDVILEGVDDYVVVGTLAYREEQDAWHLYVLDAGARRRLLEVRRKGGVLQAALLDPVDDAPIHGQLSSGLTYRQRPLQIDGRGDARVTPSGDTGERNQAMLLKYARYSGPGGALLLVEDELGQKRALYGQLVPETALQIYPHA